MAACDFVISGARDRLYPVAAIYVPMDEADLERIMQHPAAMTGSGGLTSMLTPHPRVLGH